eukprot:Sspe_Gene.92879::Locus_65638_Transcript_1_1_Confidence_1.000_Length_1405::g.92879::m.92879/K01291/CPB1; carboxypeptidase B
MIALTVFLLFCLGASSGTSVFSITEVTRGQAHRILTTPCKECRTEDGLVDVWLPDGLTVNGTLGPLRRMDVRGGEELEAVLRNLGLVPNVMHRNVEAIMAANQTVGASSYHESYHTYEETVTQLAEFARLHTGTTYIPSIGSTVEGRSIAAFKMGTGKNLVYFQCGIHAREWISPATCMYLIDQLLTSRDPILSKLTIYFVPVLNADGYAYTWSTNRMWRKNRQRNPDGSYGVDLNRNWDDGHWGLCGASTNPRSDTYMGPGPFSEPETQAVRTLFAELKSEGYHIQAGIDFHAYGQLILRPYGWTLPNRQCPDGRGPPCVPANEDELERLGATMQSEILKTSGMRYTNEHAAELYCAAGGTDDWIAVSTVQANGYCLELRDTGRYGFVLPANQIIPTGEEVLAAMRAYLTTVASNIE